MTDPVADVTEKHRILLVAAGTATTSFFKKGRKFIFMVHSPEKGLEVVPVQAYAKGADFTGSLPKVRAANPDVLAAGTYLDDGVAITHLPKELNVKPKMYRATIGGALPRFYEALGRNAEFLYANSPWEPELVTLRASGLIPVARQYPGAREFVEAHHREYAGRDAILKLDFNAVFGPFNVDPDGLQIAHKMLMLQWQDGKKIIVWPEELATGKPCFPTPPWSGRK